MTRGLGRRRRRLRGTLPLPRLFRVPPRPGSRGPQPRAQSREGRLPKASPCGRQPSPRMLTGAPGATPPGGGVGMGLGIASGGPGRTTTLAGPSHAAAAPRDTSPISAGSQRCRATVRPPKAPGLPGGLAQAFRALNVPVPGASDLRARRPSSPLCAASLSSTTARCILGPPSVLVPLQPIHSVPNTPAFQSPTATNLPELSHLRNPVDLACEGPLPCLAPTPPKVKGPPCPTWDPRKSCLLSSSLAPSLAGLCRGAPPSPPRDR